MEQLAVSRAFRAAIHDHFDGYLNALGFVATQSIATGDRFTVVFRNADRYVKVEASLHQFDRPFHCYLSLGEGSDEMPESDWNSVALWRMIKDVSAEDYAKAVDLLQISDGITAEQIDEMILRNFELFERFAAGFLAGDTSQFKRVRAELNKGREAYKVYSPSGSGYSMRLDEVSAKLKDKYSK
jgi:hypothetical protein